MINWIKSAELNNCTVEELKAYFDKYPGSNKKIIRICDGCDEERKIGFRFYRDLCRKCTNRTPEQRKARSEAGIKNNAKGMVPLPPGQEIKIPKNKNCASYLGCLAEELLAKTFKDVRRMPPNNKGFDLICSKGQKIDVKSSALGHKRFWVFVIKKNTIADYFLCMAFESRNDITPTHVWLIPGSEVNHKNGIHISKTRLAKWAKYEQPLDQVLACCNAMKQPKV